MTGPCSVAKSPAALGYIMMTSSAVRQGRNNFRMHLSTLSVKVTTPPIDNRDLRVCLLSRSSSSGQRACPADVPIPAPSESSLQVRMADGRLHGPPVSLSSS